MALERASLLGCDAVQLFAGSPRSWARGALKEEDARDFKAKRRILGIRVVAVHTSYLINLSSPDASIYRRSLGLFKKELASAGVIGADYLVTHLGSHRHRGIKFALHRLGSAIESVGRAGMNTTILFENSAGAGDTFGSRLNEIGLAIERAEAAGLSCGLCFDTCHGLAAGYRMRTEADIDALTDIIKNEVGIERLKLIHLNDSKHGLGSSQDRHEHIGKGKIGVKGLHALLSRPEFNSIPLILETPKKNEEDDRRNLRAVRKLLKWRLKCSTL